MSLQSPVSPIQRLLAFLTDKIPNSFCLQVRPVRLTVEQANLRVKLETSTVALNDSVESNQSLSETESALNISARCRATIRQPDKSAYLSTQC